MNTTTTRHPNSLANLANADVIRKAWALRKEAAKQHNVRCSFISWRSCLHVAMGRAKRLTDVAGFTLGCKQSKLTEYIFDPETPVVLRGKDMEGVAGACLYRVNSWLRTMAEKGFVSVAQAGQWTTTNAGRGMSFLLDAHVTYTVVDAKRPYSNLVAA